ncbi:M48 family metallopeptidase [Teredinibacter sp. KSP-S5-2]|uniref:M48 family metallopeptidase n=1 Tax=Teredinibacter sp. KSP-S5-2 TaxID=3034506 RepID=UPI0029352DAD|nr:M48 family metallopeptidase [Teredinibacter sp. KSP-S5-2]WNO08546.1 M48 family metallopeptidase [Teredinibacter sp. KSP-S5-2]
MHVVHGHYHNGQTSGHVSARLEVSAASTLIKLICSAPDGAEQISHLPLDSIKIESRLGNTPREIQLEDGGLFISEDFDAVDQLSELVRGDKSRDSFLHKLESSLPLILASVVLTVAFSWFVVVVGVPQFAKFVAFNLPEFASEELAGGLDILDKTVFDPSELASDREEEIRQLLAPYIQDHTELNPTLAFRSGMGANAFALPGGQIVFTDDFVGTVDDDRELVAVFLHELGHLKYKHLLRRTIQDSISTIVVLMLTGDLETMEMMLALPTVVLDLSYSRDFEREADEYAVSQLDHYGISVDYFAQAMKNLQDYYQEKEGKPVEANDEQNKGSFVLDYLSTHPPTQERLEMVEHYKNSQK